MEKWKQYYEDVLINQEYEFYARNHDFILDPNLVNNHVEFIEYCYYIKYHENDNDINQILNTKEIIEEYPKTYDDTLYDKTLTVKCYHKLTGCFAITAAILSEDINIKKKRYFINTLIIFGFEYSKDDLMLAGLEVYDAIPMTVKINIMYFLNNEGLLSEIKWYIIKILIYKYIILCLLKYE